MLRRWRIMCICIAVIFALLAVRLTYIQIAGQKELSAAAYAQQQIKLEGADKRGTIYDRNGNAVAGQQMEYIYIIKEKDFDGETMNALNQLDAEEVGGQTESYRVFTSKYYDKDTGERLIRNSDAYIVEAARRYSDDQPAVHLIGYINSSDSSGASGLELQYDDELSETARSVSATADVNGSFIKGRGLTVTSSAEEELMQDGITTTLDLGLQKKVEDILSDAGKPGAAVVLKSDTGEILASASTPVFDPENIDDYMESHSGELINKVTQGEYPPGSVFKIIVAAAALEAGISPDETYICSGSQTIGDGTVKCSTGGDEGHGNISFSQAFADSCNCAFIQIAEKTGAEKIYKMAVKAGLGMSVLNGYPGEKTGCVMSLQQSQGAAIANLALGQGENLVTPLQVAAVTDIIAANGIRNSVCVVNDHEEVLEPERVMSEETAAAIQKMMEATMLSGTGKSLTADVSMAAKTGSAESVQGGAEVVHGWITGFVPAEEPEYVITVFIEDGKSGSGSAGPVFSEIAQYLADSAMIQNEVEL